VQAILRQRSFWEETGTKDQGTGTKDQGTGTKDQGTGTKDQGTGTKDQALRIQVTDPVGGIVFLKLPMRLCFRWRSQGPCFFPIDAVAAHIETVGRAHELDCGVGNRHCPVSFSSSLRHSLFVVE
jgi:hypothetical protein